MTVDGLTYDQLLGKGWRKKPQLVKSFEGEGKGPRVVRKFELAVKHALLQVVPPGIEADDIRLSLSPNSVTVKAEIDASGCSLDGLDVETFIHDQANKLSLLASEGVSTVPGVPGQVQVSLVGVTGWGKKAVVQASKVVPQAKVVQKVQLVRRFQDAQPVGARLELLCAGGLALAALVLSVAMFATRAHRRSWGGVMAERPRSLSSLLGNLRQSDLQRNGRDADSEGGDEDGPLD